MPETMSDRSSSEHRWNLIADIFASALEMPAATRHAYVMDACQGDGVVRREVLAMLEAHEAGDPLLLEEERRVRPSDPALHVSDLAPGTRLGPWRVDRLVAQGGMGEVYRAERVDGAYSQTVAIKVLRPGYRTAETVRRFRVERQALARLVHPGIAAIVDGGALEDGRPYLVLQYVEGEPITRYCVERRLPLAARLRLLVRVARVVEFAHSQLVIHRDLKPSNILVEADGTPRLLDFGIARMLDPTLDEALVRPTRPETRLLTPEHAAPEQLRGEACDTRTDVYGLGVLLFELLTDRTPFPQEGRSLPELERAILELPAPLPSTVVPDKMLQRALRGDLDVISQAALRKESARRYSSAAALADDLERYLDGLPVRAQPDRLAYRARKFISRNRGLVLGGAGLALLLLGFGITATIQARRLARERDRAERERAVAADMVQILTGLFERANPHKVAGGDTVRVAALLEEAEQRIERLVDDPERQAALLHTVGQMHEARGNHPRAEGLLRRSAEQRWRLHGADDLEAARIYHELGTVVHYYRGPQASRPMFDSSLARFRRIEGPSGPDVRVALNDLAQATTDPAARRALFAELVALETRTPGIDSMAIAGRLHTEASDLLQRGRPVEAMALFQATLDIVSARLPPEDPIRLVVRNNLASALSAMGEVAQAESLQRAALAQTLKGEVSPDAKGGAYERLALTLAREGKFEEAGRLEREALTLLERGLAPDNPLIGNAQRNLAIILGRLGREQEGLALLDSAIAQARALGTVRGADAVYKVAQRVPLLLRLGRVAEASAAAALADSVLGAAVPEGDPRQSDRARWMAMTAFARKDYAGAVQAASLGYEIQSGFDPRPDHTLAQAECMLGVALEGAGRLVEAIAHVQRGCSVLDPGGIEDPMITAWGRVALTRLREGGGRLPRPGRQR
jgi:serine/threonine-protein kinase